MVFLDMFLPNALQFVMVFQQKAFMLYSTFPCRKVTNLLPQVLKTYKRPFMVRCCHRCITEVPYQDNDIRKLASVQKKIIPKSISLNRESKIIIAGQLLGSVEPKLVYPLLNTLNLHKLKPQFLDKYDVRITEDKKALIFPLFNHTGEILAVQYLDSCNYIDALAENVFPCDNYTGLYGWKKDFLMKGILVVTSNPVDAIVVNQEADLPAVSFPFRNCRFPLEMFSLLRQFQKIIVWFSEVNCSAQKLFIQNLDKKAFIISSKKHLTPLVMLQNGSNIKSILSKEACPLKHSGVKFIWEYRDSVYDQLKNSDKFSGTKWGRFSHLNEVLKGHRSGELTVFSGQTGTGKTTFMSEYSLDLCMQGVNTLWGSFEIPDDRLLKTMLTQFSLYDLESFPQVFSKFEDLHMYFIKFDAEVKISDIIKTMTFMVDSFGVKHVVIDNLQFMLNNEDLNGFIDYWQKQDQIYRAFRRFATFQNCHITLVMHPRKEPEFNELNNTSISGSARAIQEADNIMILQTTKTKQYLQITKNRYDGEKGCILLEFDPNTVSYTMKKTFKTP